MAAFACAAPSGLHGGVAEAAVLTGPSGVVTNHGAIGPVAVGHGLGWGHGLGLGLGLGLGHGAVLAAPAVVAAPAVAAVAPVAVGHGVVTNGGGTIGVGAHGAAVRGPPTAPVVVAGPSGKIAADGLWGPTANVGLGHGAWAHGGAWSHGGWGHGW